MSPATRGGNSPDGDVTTVTGGAEGAAARSGAVVTGSSEVEVARSAAQEAVGVTEGALTRPREMRDAAEAGPAAAEIAAAVRSAAESAGPDAAEVAAVMRPAAEGAGQGAAERAAVCGAAAEEAGPGALLVVAVSSGAAGTSDR